MGCIIAYPKCQEEFCNNSIVIYSSNDRIALLPNQLQPFPSKTFEQEDNNYSFPMQKQCNNNNVMSNSQNNTNSKSVAGIEGDNLSLLMLSEINSARESPEIYSKKISDLLDKIESVNGKNVLNYNDKFRIEMNKGKEALEDCIKYLNEKTDKLPPLIMKDDLKIPFPSETPDKCIDTLYLNDILSEKTSETHIYTLVDFQYDISPTPGLSTLIQIVDDTNSKLQRRKNIFSNTIKYIGINYGKMNEDVYCFYLLFAK